MTYNEFCNKYPEHREEIEERAAIIQYDGEEDQQEAESIAVGQMRTKYDLWFQKDLFKKGD